MRQPRGTARYATLCEEHWRNTTDVEHKTMAWAWRGHRRYYSRSVRDGGRVTKAYVGTGLLAEFHAAQDAEQQAERDATRAAWRQHRTDMDAIDAQVKA